MILFSRFCRPETGGFLLRKIDIHPVQEYNHLLIHFFSS